MAFVSGGNPQNGRSIFLSTDRSLNSVRLMDCDLDRLVRGAAWIGVGRRAATVATVASGVTGGMEADTEI